MPPPLGVAGADGRADAPGVADAVGLSDAGAPMVRYVLPVRAKMPCWVAIRFALSSVPVVSAPDGSCCETT